MKITRYYLMAITMITSVFAAEPKGLAAIGAGLVVIGAAIGIAIFTSAAANATARQPEAAEDIRSTVNLPLFLLEGVAVLAIVVCILEVVI